MLSKCANPTCSATFRYLSEGKLYLVDSKAATVRHGARAELKYAGASCIYEYFWLCSACCRDMTIRIDHNFEISAVRKQGIHQDEANTRGASTVKNISAA